MRKIAQTPIGQYWKTGWSDTSTSLRKFWHTRQQAA